MKKTILIKPIAVASIAMALSLQVPAQQTYQGKVGKTLDESKEWWPAPVTPPKGSPNVVWIVLDDVGYGATSTFGGLIQTPTFDSLANNGLRYTNFHTAAICAPTRAALLTGRNSSYVHEAGFSHTVLSAGFPGWDGRIPADKGTIAQALKENGYNTFAVGKFGVTPDEEATDAGPFDHWPSGLGFEHFFGFLGSQTDQYHPDLVEDNAHVTPDGRHLSDQITDKAIAYISRQQKAAPDKPFFLYYAPAAVHAPHQVDKFWSDKYKGKFDEGWDVYRQKVIANQIKLGVIPANAKLPERNSNIPEWNSLSADQKKVYTRFMETYAGYLTYADFTVSRLVNYLREKKLLDNTLIFVLIGDNGASKEGTFQGVINKSTFAAGGSEEKQFLDNLNNIGEIGTPEGKNTNYPLGWAQATNTPFKYWKQDANSEGGTHNPLIVFWPNGIKEKGEIRTQYGYVNDLYPTTLDILGIQQPQYLKGIKQDTLQGSSFASSIHNAVAPSLHHQQYYYIFGSRSVYNDGWKLGTYHHPDIIDLGNVANGKIQPVKRDFDKDVWELYNLKEDFNERNDLAAKYPEKVEELKKHRVKS